MNFTLICAGEGDTAKPWRESYYDDDIYSMDGAREYCEEMIGEFNRTLKPREVARVLIDVVPIEKGDTVRPTSEQREREQEEWGPEDEDDE